MKNLFVLCLVILAGSLLAACGAAVAQAAPPSTPIPTVVAESAITAEGRLEPVQFAEIAFSTSGVVSQVLVEEGESVKKGQPLVHLGDESDTNYAAAQLDLVSAQQALNDLLGAAGTTFAQTVIDLKDAQEEYNKADDYLKYLQRSNKVPQTETRTFLIQTWKGYEYQYKTKSFKGPAPEDWITEAQNDLALKKARLDELQRAHDRMQNGADAEQVALLEARLSAAKAKVSAFSVIAPFDGVVAEMNAKKGSSINAGEIAVTVADFSGWIIKTTDLTELDVVNITEGQAVLIALDAFPEETMNGEVQLIGQNYSEKQGDVVYEVTVKLSDSLPNMRWGMTAVVKFAD
ncbi:MAG TPA: efflux RND transporter periplasmic adaptor subunit [Anaerolineales bacterium]|nr:efflux RND transporter periplasmic adaptor subunit [Anaerolineales bacterium]